MRRIGIEFRRGMRRTQLVTGESFAMRPSLGLHLGAQLNITPQLLQSIRLLQLTGAELEAHVRDALDSNPMLESEGVDDAGEGSAENGEAAAGDESSTVRLEAAEANEFWRERAFERSGGAALDDEGEDMRFAEAAPGVRMHVLRQLELMLDARSEVAVAAWLIDQVDDAGYLEREPERLQEALPRDFGVHPARLEEIRQLMMRLDPAGYGARDLRECLLVQLGELPPETPSRHLALRLVLNHLTQLGDPDRPALCEQLGVEAEELATAERLILALDPKPGLRDAGNSAGYVIPDVLVLRDERGWQIGLNHAAAPRIRVNQVYEGMLSRSGSSAGARELKQLLQEARWLTRALAMRHDTLLKVARCIVARQIGFLERGDEAMQPLTLREVADAIGMHESTVSRITTGKYMQTPRGTFELKHFFAGRLQGAEIAGVAIRAMVKRLIDGESPADPLADDTIAALLARQGVRIARRTVAKYRELLRIAPAKDRRRSTPSPVAA
jgi:RNA polymerase sigma-54 factor